VALVFVVCIAWWWHNANVRTRNIQVDAIKSFERDATEHIPRGSTKLQVEGYLKSRKMIFVNREEPGTPLEARSTDAIPVPIGACFVIADFNFDPSDTLLDSKYETTCKSTL
jgi:hypothetical protein